VVKRANALGDHANPRDGTNMEQIGLLGEFPAIWAE
jgi:hypothetical protein